MQIVCQKSNRSEDKKVAMSQVVFQVIPDSFLYVIITYISILIPLGNHLPRTCHGGNSLPFHGCNIAVSKIETTLYE